MVRSPCRRCQGEQPLLRAHVCDAGIDMSHGPEAGRPFTGAPCLQGLGGHDLLKHCAMAQCCINLPGPSDPVTCVLGGPYPMAQLPSSMQGSAL